ncbi:glycosyltransferase family 2 protein [Sphingomonas sp. AP4-R1]|uniref:glycosyltransferase family 2 protein n=1 Tax=Sphingomonas sp. AP4-R1 TaxID=2735134 RepID=UPI0014934CB8|nr:glycosyltransferase [Sphingomonas sp. AP4-R1]QJU57271.1 glycosyltransferase family 2 protein [Sphingomonas sp. AP4-R1]
MSGTPRFSIVILTFAREAILAQVLDRLAGHLAGRSDYELIIVDNNIEPVDRTAQLAPFHSARHLWDGRNKGVVARNLGFDAAAGEIVVLLDDDVFVDTPDFLDRFGARFTAAPRLGCVTIRKYVKGDTRRRVDLIPHTDKSVDLARPFPTFRFVGGCVGFRAAMLGETGGFLPDFFYGLEEIELSYRMIDRGWTLLYDPDIVCEELEHPAGRRPKRLVQADRLTNKFIISFLHMPSPYVWLNLIAFPPYAYFFSRGEMDVPLAVRQFVAWLRKPDRLRRHPIGRAARDYIRQCGGHLWR